MTTMMNGSEHEVCETCGCVVGHGCPNSEQCDRVECAEPEMPAVPGETKAERDHRLMAQWESDEAAVHGGADV